MMDIHGQFTKKGLTLAAKLTAGETLKITRVVAGAGETAQTASALSQIRQTATVGRPLRREDTTTLPVTLAAGLAETAYTLRELGVYAQDPDEGEILYKVYRLSEPVGIAPNSRLVLRFYLEETVSQDLNVTVNCAPAGLVLEKEFEPVRDVVEKTAVSSRSVSVAAADLPAYIAALPRLLAENLTINVTGSGNVGRVIILGFYGPGTLTVNGNENVTFTEGVNVSRCYISVNLNNLIVRLNGSSRNGVYAENTLAVTLSGCTIDCNNKSTSYGADTYGGRLYIKNTKIQNCTNAVYAQESGYIVLVDCDGSGNTYGSVVYLAGAIMLCGSTPKLMGGESNRNGGAGSGVIFMGNTLPA